MKPALWISRHEPTAEQLTEIETSGFFLTNLAEGKALGSVNITSEQDVINVMGDLADLAAREKAARIFGVFSAPIQERLLDRSTAAASWGDFTGKEIPCFAAWNIQRTAEGGKPTFHHQRFCMVGHI